MVATTFVDSLKPAIKRLEFAKTVCKLLHTLEYPHTIAGGKPTDVRHYIAFFDLLSGLKRYLAHDLDGPGVTLCIDMLMYKIDDPINPGHFLDDAIENACNNPTRFHTRNIAPDADLVNLDNILNSVLGGLLDGWSLEIDRAMGSGFCLWCIIFTKLFPQSSGGQMLLEQKQNSIKITDKNNPSQALTALLTCYI